MFRLEQGRAEISTLRWIFPQSNILPLSKLLSKTFHLEIIMLLQVEHKPHISIPRKRLGQVRLCSVHFDHCDTGSSVPYITIYTLISSFSPHQPDLQRNPMHIFVGTQALQFDILHWHIATQALQFDMDLECRIEAYPPPAIRWWDH